MDQLTHWVRDNGGFISDKVEVKALPGRGNAVVAAVAIAKNEKLVSLPRGLLVNCQTVEKSDLTSHQLLAKYLLTSESPWIETLPKSFESVPLCWSDEEQELLPPKYRKRVLDQKMQVRLDHRLACPEVPFEKFLWAWLCVNSRCLYWDVGRGREENMTMAPFIDFLNHNTDQSRTVQVKTGLAMSLFANREYAIGEEICLNYGPHENAFLLCEYGFAAVDNPWDYIDLTEELEPLLRDCKSELKDLGYWGDYSLSADGPSFRTLVACEALKKSKLDQIVNGLREPDPSPPILTGIYTSLEKKYSQDTPRQELRCLFDGYLSIIQASRSRPGT